jgi:probable rRNA maturation factor
MSINFQFVAEYSRWDVKNLEKIAGRISEAINTQLQLPRNSSAVVLLCNDAKIHQLNMDFRGNDTTTNILSWPSEDLKVATAGQRPKLAVNPELGDIAMAFEVCFSEARAGHVKLSDHLAHLLLHGTLHLLGYDHIEHADAIIMEAIEIDILAKLCISNPYTINDEIQ